MYTHGEALIVFVVRSVEEGDLVDVGIQSEVSQCQERNTCVIDQSERTMKAPDMVRSELPFNCNSKHLRRVCGRWICLCWKFGKDGVQNLSDCEKSFGNVDSE